MSSHPGATIKDAVEMALWLKKWGYQPEQVQDFYPTPGTVSTVMYYTGINPLTKKAVQVTTDYHEKLLQRALLQYSRPENANLVREALRLAGREDLIGTSPECLVRPAFGERFGGEYKKPAATRRDKSPTPRGRIGASSSKYTKQKTQNGTKKLKRIFGEDTERILREVNRMSGGTGGAKNKGRKSKKQR